MNSAQKTIKYVAMGFAYLLAFSIIAGIVAAVMGIMTGIGVIGRHAPDLNIDCNKYEKCLSVSLAGSDLVIKRGDKLDYEADNDKLEVTSGDNRLTIVDKSKGGWSWFGHDNRKTVTITVPDTEFDIIGVAAAAGKISIESINTKDLKLDLGAGETTIDYVRATGDIKIDTGMGKFTIEDGELESAGIHLGIGEANIHAILTGNTKVDAGIGAVNLDLGLPESNYTYKVDKGIGQVTINGTSVSDGSTVGNGKNTIDVDGGIGSIHITNSKEAERVIEPTNAEITDKPEAKTGTEAEVEKSASVDTEQPGIRIEAPKD